MYDNERFKRIAFTMVFGGGIFLIGRMMLRFLSSNLEENDVLVAFSIQAVRIFDVIGALTMLILSILLVMSLFDIGNTVSENTERKNQIPEPKHIDLKKIELEQTIIHSTASRNKGNQYVGYRNRSHSIKNDNDLLDDILENSVNNTIATNGITSVFSGDSGHSNCTHNNDSVSSLGDSGSYD